ncbi:MAG: hypothetical protein IKR56_00455 [Lachnospiraceae bacterium]|nr:hypothetical protein [Lachnospiraceae bacterium]
MLFHKKGKFGYIDRMKKASLIRTGLFFLAALIIFAAGYFIWGKKENYLTILAVLVILPAARSLVNSIMYLRFKSCSLEVRERVDELIKEAGKEQTAPAHCFYDSVLTVERGGSYFVSLFFISTDLIAGLTPQNKHHVKIMKEHLEQMLENNNLKKVKVLIYNNEEEFFAKFKTMVNTKDEDALTQREVEILRLLEAISL